jgi:hypothetical protein
MSLSQLLHGAMGILVGLWTGDQKGERVTIVRQNGEWVITEFEMWIA